MQTLKRSLIVPAPRDRVFAFFSDPRNLAKITPKAMGFRIIHIDELPIRPGFRIEYTVKPLLGIPVRWVTRIPIFEPPFRFIDVQERGPYHYWRHEHTFEDLGDATLMRDRVDYELPLGMLGSAFGSPVVDHQLRRIFDYRSRRINKLFRQSSEISVPASTPPNDTAPHSSVRR